MLMVETAGAPLWKEKPIRLLNMQNKTSGLKTEFGQTKKQKLTCMTYKLAFPSPLPYKNTQKTVPWSPIQRS